MQKFFERLFGKTGLAKDVPATTFTPLPPIDITQAKSAATGFISISNQTENHTSNEAIRDKNVLTLDDFHNDSTKGLLYLIAGLAPECVVDNQPGSRGLTSRIIDGIDLGKLARSIRPGVDFQVLLSVGKDLDQLSDDLPIAPNVMSVIFNAFDRAGKESIEGFGDIPNLMTKEIVDDDTRDTIGLLARSLLADRAPMSGLEGATLGNWKQINLIQLFFVLQIMKADNYFVAETPNFAKFAEIIDQEEVKNQISESSSKTLLNIIKTVLSNGTVDYRK